MNLNDVKNEDSVIARTLEYIDNLLLESDSSLACIPMELLTHAIGCTYDDCYDPELPTCEIIASALIEAFIALRESIDEVGEMDDKELCIQLLDDYISRVPEIMNEISDKLRKQHGKTMINAYTDFALMYVPAGERELCKGIINRHLKCLQQQERLIDKSAVIDSVNYMIETMINMENELGGSTDCYYRLSKMIKHDDKWNAPLRFTISILNEVRK